MLSIQTLKNNLETMFLNLQVDPGVSCTPYVRTTVPQKQEKSTKIHDFVCVSVLRSEGSGVDLVTFTLQPGARVGS